MKLHDGLTQAANQSPQRSFRDVWFEFETWERSRDFRDDPSRPAKQALDWIRDLYELTVALEDFRGSPALQQCREAFEVVFEAFARLEHVPELDDAMTRWMQARN